ncbi:Cytochrome c oxidase subunit 6B-like protein [Wallemia ichthyophaga EXF-994]|uniref:Cytochrome c oxidase subunit 6B-like protein n=1 Tax=Wallemia ichthyophaga (strain EXF-994 / CBS 113033) TaxID=1299270 RepID=R9ABM8_WALI9|nr:Cytochrome c oxidase subunit 6B-like protein [Wallemia ichthyophaga EXF-994]EOQ99618.1 Cytochrome c oxidase subunit 6B-like protein [Wallemia ichthyophaga EXF-994]
MWWPFKSEDKDVPSSKAKTLTREERQACWSARDKLFDCLGSTPTSDNEEIKRMCPREFKAYEGACAASWIDYFIKRRMLEMRQQATQAAAS